jgi:hypothetical protein
MVKQRMAKPGASLAGIRTCLLTPTPSGTGSKGTSSMCFTLIVSPFRFARTVVFSSCDYINPKPCGVIFSPILPPPGWLAIQ